MERKSTLYQRINSRGFAEEGIAFLLVIYPLLFLLTQRNMGSVAVGFCALYCLFHLNLRLLGGLKYFLAVAAGIFGISFFKGFQAGFSLPDMGKEFYYYLKPLLFFFFGALGIRIFHRSAFFKIVLGILVLGTALFYLFPGEFISASHDKSGIGRGWGHFLTFRYFLRSGSFLLSPLETAFLSSFLGLYFFFNRNQLRLGRLYFLIATFCLFLSMTRSVILIYGIALLYLYLNDGRFPTLKTWVKYAALFGTASLIALAGFLAKSYLIKNDGSIFLHFENLSAVLTNLKLNPWGYGMSSSGYVAVLRGRDALYSEGSFFTYLIECGVQGLFFYGILAYYCFRKGPLTFALYLFFQGVSLVLPIGFSTLFDFLFFGTLGSISIWNENRNFDHKLQ